MGTKNHRQKTCPIHGIGPGGTDVADGTLVVRGNGTHTVSVSLVNNKTNKCPSGAQLNLKRPGHQPDGANESSRLLPWLMKDGNSNLGGSEYRGAPPVALVGGRPLGVQCSPWRDESTEHGLGTA